MRVAAAKALALVVRAAGLATGRLEAWRGLTAGAGRASGPVRASVLGGPGLASPAEGAVRSAAAVGALALNVVGERAARQASGHEVGAGLRAVASVVPASLFDGQTCTAVPTVDVDVRASGPSVAA